MASMVPLANSLISRQNFEISGTPKVVISWLFTEVDVPTFAFKKCVFFCRFLQKTSYERNSSDIYFRKKPGNNYFSVHHYKKQCPNCPNNSKVSKPRHRRRLIFPDLLTGNLGFRKVYTLQK